MKHLLPHSNSPCQLSLWEETGEAGENPWLFRQSVEELYTHVRSDVRDRTYDLSSGRMSFRRLSHRNPIRIGSTPTFLYIFLF